MPKYNYFMIRHLPQIINKIVALCRKALIIHGFSFFINHFCYKKTSPLDVLPYAVGYPKASIALLLLSFFVLNIFSYPLNWDVKKAQTTKMPKYNYFMIRHLPQIINKIVVWGGLTALLFLP